MLALIHLAATFAAKLLLVPLALGAMTVTFVVCLLCLLEEQRASRARDNLNHWAPLRVAVWLIGASGSLWLATIAWDAIGW